MAESGFELRAVAKSYGGQPILEDISHGFRAGARTALVGPSGCGKSTLLRLLAGLEAPTSGRILLDGEVLSGSGRILRPPHRRRIGMVFQDLALWPNLSVIENVTLGQDHARSKRGELAERARRMLAACGIESLRDRKPGTLSGGQQQRVALARALAAGPRHLFLDEPFSGLDLGTKTEILNEINRLARDRGLSVLLVTHDPQELRALCDTVIVLEAGRLVEAGPLGERLRSPKSETLASFKACIAGEPA